MVRYSSSLASHNMISQKDLCLLNLKNPVEKLYKNNSITSVEADNSKNEFHYPHPVTPGKV